MAGYRSGEFKEELDNVSYKDPYPAGYSFRRYGDIAHTINELAYECLTMNSIIGSPAERYVTSAQIEQAFTRTQPDDKCDSVVTWWSTFRPNDLGAPFRDPVVARNKCRSFGWSAVLNTMVRRPCRPGPKDNPMVPNATFPDEEAKNAFGLWILSDLEVLQCCYIEHLEDVLAVFNDGECPTFLPNFATVNEHADCGYAHIGYRVDLGQCLGCLEFCEDC